MLARAYDSPNRKARDYDSDRGSREAARRPREGSATSAKRQQSIGTYRNLPFSGGPLRAAFRPLPARLDSASRRAHRVYDTQHNGEACIQALTFEVFFVTLTPRRMRTNIESEPAFPFAVTNLSNSAHLIWCARPGASLRTDARLNRIGC
jgi:hypothetical protein